MSEFIVNKQVVALCLFAIIVSLFSAVWLGMDWGRTTLCEDLNGTYLQDSRCVQDKCLSDITVCKEGDTVYFVNLTSSWSQK